jgi:nucleoside-diphosphate-sugar epimerase
MARAITCAVTGASGYVGSAIARELVNAGMQVRALDRKDSSGIGGPVFRLGEQIDDRLLEGAAALVHCAWDFHLDSWEHYQTVNVAGSRQLFAAARKVGVQRIVFISTMSAFSGCKSQYGQAKLAVEQEAEKWEVDIVRPGLVYGPACRGMVGSLAKVAKLPLIPLVGTGSQLQYMIHEADLGNVVAKLCGGSLPFQAGHILASQRRPYAFREILRLLAAARGHNPLLVPVPWRLEWLVLKVFETIGIKSRLRSDSLVSLVNQDPSPDFETTRRTGVAFRDFADEVEKRLVCCEQ